MNSSQSALLHAKEGSSTFSYNILIKILFYLIPTMQCIKSYSQAGVEALPVQQTEHRCCLQRIWKYIFALKPILYHIFQGLRPHATHQRLPCPACGQRNLTPTMKHYILDTSTIRTCFNPQPVDEKIMIIMYDSVSNACRLWLGFRMMTAAHARLEHKRSTSKCTTPHHRSDNQLHCPVRASVQSPTLLFLLCSSVHDLVSASLQYALLIPTCALVVCRGGPGCSVM